MLLLLELLGTGWELVMAVLAWVAVWVVMGVSEVKGLFLVSVGDAFRDCAIGVRQICWLIDDPGSLSSSSDSASDMVSSSEVFSSSLSMRTCMSDRSVLYSSSCGMLALREYVLVSPFQWTSVHLSLCTHTSLGCVSALLLALTITNAPWFVRLAG